MEPSWQRIRLTLNKEKRLSDTRHSLADGEGKKALLQVDGADLARLVRIGKAIGQADTTLEEVLQACILHSLLMAEEEPALFKEFAKIFSPKNHIFVKPAREGIAVYNPFTMQALFALQGEQDAQNSHHRRPACQRRVSGLRTIRENQGENRWQLHLIPVGIEVPGQYVEFDASQAGATTQARRMLVVGQTAAGGSAPAGAVKRVDSVGKIAGLFGAGSQVGAMARSATTAQPTAQVWALPLADAANASKATATITVSASSAKAGTIALVVAGQRVAVGVKASERATAIATAIKTALNTAAPALPVVAASPASSGNANANANAVTLTCRWGGTTGNQIDLRHFYRQEDALPSGVSLALTAFSGGATDPDLSTALAALGDTQYHTLALPYSDSAAVSALDAVLQERWKPTVAKEGVAFIPAVGTLSDMTTLGEAYNSHLLCLVGVGKR